MISYQLPQNKIIKPVSYFDLSVPVLTDQRLNNNIHAPKKPIKDIPIDDVISQVSTGYVNTSRIVLPCKADRESVYFGRPYKPKNEWMYPSTGYARHQSPGLSTDFNKPMNLPVMSIAGYFNPSLPNTLGNVKG